MDEDEAALLAELRAISNRSAVSRFEDEGNNNDDNDGIPPPSPEQENRSPTTLPGKTISAATISTNDYENQRLQHRDGAVGNNDDGNMVGVDDCDYNDDDLLDELLGDDELLEDDDKEEDGDDTEVFHDASRGYTPQKPSPDSTAQEESPSTSAPGEAHQGAAEDPDFAKQQAARPSSPTSVPTAAVGDGMAVQAEQLPPEGFLGGAGSFKKESTFQGERGGAAEDAELLALLRGVSAKSSGADRFADEVDDAGGMRTVPAPSDPPLPQPTNKTSRNQGAVPPWKQKVKSAKSVPSIQEDIIVAAPKVQPPQAAGQVDTLGEDSPPPEAVLGGAGNFKKESTFQGERGGAAEDAELLALLRGVSAKSSGADRFAEQGDAPQAPVPAPRSIPQLAKKKSTAAGSELPPWKKGKAQTVASTVAGEDFATEVAAPVSSTESAVCKEPPNPDGASNFKQKSNFSGERGGAAEDEELLALLRQVSAKSSGVDRFAEEGGVERPSRQAQPPPQTLTAPTMLAADEDAARLGGAGNFKQESNFQGERGGCAEDAELLALLRGVSARSGGTDRFAADGDAPSAPPAAPTPSKTIFSVEAPAPVMSPTSQPEDAVAVTRDKLPECVMDSNWKVRRDSYILLRAIVLEHSMGREPCGEIVGDVVMPGLDRQVSGYLMDKNAVALEEALQFAVVYADYCQGGASVELAETMIKNLIQGGGFSSSRPKAAKAAAALTLKLIEVSNGTDSINAVVGVLLDLGLSSKKPKIVQVSTALILEAAQSFGAASLPLAAIKQSLTKMIAHNDKKVRDLGVELVAELCRALGGKSALGDVIEHLKAAQIIELDTLLEKQPIPTKIKVGLRSGRGSETASPEDAIASLQAGAAALEAERYANRPAVNLPLEVTKSEYVQHLKLAKWSEKVTGLKMILECGGEKPYKLMPPSSSVNYAPLISEMKGVLSHTHFAVVGKALEVLSMLAEGVGEKLYPNLRPLLPTLFALSKDKKLTKAVLSCLDSFFGNVLSFEHILDVDSAIPSAVDERQEKNALARTLALEFLERCVSRGKSAGPRGALESSSAKNAARLSSEKLGDSDASVRKAALNVLKTLLMVENPELRRAVEMVVADLERSQPRAFKQLGSVSVAAKPSNISRPSPVSSPVKARPATNTVAKMVQPPKETAKKPEALAAPQKPLARQSSLSMMPCDFNVGENYSVEDATNYVASLSIPSWDAEDEDGGVLAGLLSPKWILRQNAIKAIAAFVNERELPSSSEALQNDSAYILVLVKEHTRGFKETNVNVTKSIMELCLAICDCHEKSRCPVPTWAARDMATLCCSKLSEKKLAPLAKALLLSACVVQLPHLVIGQSCATMAHIKSPLSQEEFLKWMKTFAAEFGAASIGPGLSEVIIFLSEHCDSNNLKVKQAAHAVVGIFHVQLGPPFEALVLGSLKDPALRSQIQKTISENEHDATSLHADWPKRSIASAIRGIGETESSPSGAGIAVALPKFDLLAELPPDCIERMGSTESKTAWKARKAALEDVESTLGRCVGLLDTTKLNHLVDLLRALRGRLSDSQSNLKPVAARLIGKILSLVDAPSQAKLGKIAYGPLISCAMNEQRKIMHDACMDALGLGTSLPKLEGGGSNEHALEPFVVGLVGALDESDFKSAGIADVLDLTKSFAGRLPDLDSVASQAGNTLGGRLANVLVQGLSSSKADIRFSSESLLDECVKKGVIGIITVKKIASRQKPAIQRAIAPIVTKLSGPALDTCAVSDSNEAVEDLVDKEEPSISKRISGSKVTKPAVVSRPHLSKSMNESPILSRTTESSLRSVEISPRRNTSVSNPLVANAGSFNSQKSKAAVKSMTWPEYPEEPSGALVFNALKKAWSPLIPVESSKQLFPEGGIKKQDDAMEGFELLTRAIVMERADEGCAIGEQFSFIWKWMTYVLCCKESTVGLQALLQLASDLVDHLRSISYELSDSEAMVFLPHLFDKASAAKDTFADLIEQIKVEELLPAKRLGPIVCVAVIEGSSHPKARLLACKECFNCVDKIGLSGIGKRGVLAFAKALSEEKLQENRNALVDLMVMLVSRMNGDMQRFTRICGASLSGKGRSLIEEQLAKGDSGGQTGIPRTSIPKPSPRTASQRSSIQPKPARSTPSKLPVLRSKQTLSPNGHKTTVESNSEEGFEDELPALDLRFGMRASQNGSTFIPSSGPSDEVRISPSRVTSPAEELSPFDPSDNFAEQCNAVRESKDSAIDDNEIIRTALFSESDGVIETKDSSDSGGAAASLRARLLKIRERNKTTTGSIPSSHSPDDAFSKRSAGEETYSMSSNGNVDGDIPQETKTCEDLEAEEALVESTTAMGSSGYIEKFLATIRQLLSRTLPLSEEDDQIIESTDVLKSIHAAVSQQAHLAVKLNEAAVSQLRVEIVNNSNEVVETLTRLINFGFKCHDTEICGGLSVPLLSVNLASLMAIFRSEDISKTIRVEDLTVLIKEAGKALLDPRLASASAVNGLDEATSTQMVRAINKLAVQAATGATRHHAFEALMSLQQQLCLKVDDSYDPVFNSRLSRVVAKLFARVVKAEEASHHPFSSSSVDMEAVICFLEDTLVACDEVDESKIPQDAVVATKNNARVLVTAILKARGEMESFQRQMNELNIDSVSSSLGKLVSECASQLGLPSGLDTSFTSASRDLSALVSAVGEAPLGSEREAAIAALRRYRDDHGEEDLNKHLTDVSAAFRDFVLEQLSGASGSQEQDSVASNSMSERIRSLRSKLNATEVVVHAAVHRSDAVSNSSSSATSSPPKAAVEAVAAKPTAASPVNVRAFRERLAAAQEKRTTGNDTETQEVSEPIATAGSRAAALRARLQAVKRQSEQSGI